MTETLVAPSAIEQGLLSGCLSRGADFEVYTDALKADENANPGHYVVTMIGSSTVKDLQGDTMTMPALDDMTKVQDGMIIWLNHSYSVPSDCFGSLYGRPWIKSSNGIADLHLSAEVETDNPSALQTYNMITKGRRKFGCSIGCQVLDYDYDKDSDGLIIRSVQTVEWSIVGIPANFRCWVEVATKSLFERALLEGRGDDALKLASAVKGMYSTSYNNIVKHIESPGLKRDLEHITPRNTVPHRIMTAFNDGEACFALADRKGITKSLSRDEVSALLTKSTQEYVSKDVLNTTTGGELIRQDLDQKEKDDMKDTEKAVEVASDGSHAAMTGTHSHAHPAYATQGEDATHEHSHAHDNDANHHHSHAEKSAEVETTKDGEPEVAKEQEVETVKDAEEETVTETPTEVTKSVDEAVETLPEVVKEETPAVAQEIDPEKLGLLSAYNTIGKQLGFEPANMEKKKGIGNPDDLQELITCISQADQCIDRAMMLIGIPDADGVSSPLGMYSLDVQFQKALTDALTLKTGAAISAANKDIIKAMHDHSKASHDLAATLHPDSCKCDSMGNQGTDFDNARQDAEFQMGNENGSKAYTPLVDAMTSLSDALKSLDMPSITNQVNSAQEALQTIKKQMAVKSQELNNLTQTMNVLKNAPLGRPTQLNRATVPGEATYADMKVAGGQSLSREDIVGMTSVHQTPFGLQRHWPATVGSEHRPTLTLDQRSLMHPYVALAYENGQEADVPMIDDPFGA